MSIGNCITFSEPIEIVAAEAIVPEITFINNVLNTIPASAYQWYINGNPIEEANDQMLIPNVNGDYHVEVLYENGCYYNSEPYAFFSTSTHIPFNQQIELFPNPVEDQLFLRVDSEQSSKIQLQWMDIVGKRIYQEEIQVVNSNLHALNLPDLTTGIYLLQIDNGTEKITRKVFKR